MSEGFKKTAHTTLTFKDICTNLKVLDTTNISLGWRCTIIIQCVIETSIHLYKYSNTCISKKIVAHLGQIILDAQSAGVDRIKK